MTAPLPADMATNAEKAIQRDMQLLEQRAAAVAAFKKRVNTEGMTRPARSPVERAFLESIGAPMPFRETDLPRGSR